MLPTGPVWNPRDVLRRRVAAACIDLVPVAVLAFGLIDRTPNAGFNIELRGTKMLLVAVVGLLYYLVAELLTGTTLGKRLLGLRVVAEDGRPVGPRGVLLRSLFRVVDGLPVMYLLGLVVARSTPTRQRVGDIVGRTRVVADADAVEPSPRAAWHLQLLVILAAMVLVFGAVTVADQLESNGRLDGFDLDDEVRPYAAALADGPLADLDTDGIADEMLDSFTRNGRVASDVAELRGLVGSVESFTLRDENIIRNTRILDLGGYVDVAEYRFDADFERGDGSLVITVFVNEGELTLLGWNMSCADCDGS